jgi:hypothetical protein
MFNLRLAGTFCDPAWSRVPVENIKIFEVSKCPVSALSYAPKYGKNLIFRPISKKTPTYMSTFQPDPIAVVANIIPYFFKQLEFAVGQGLQPPINFESPYQRTKATISHNLGYPYRNFLPSDLQNIWRLRCNHILSSKL